MKPTSFTSCTFQKSDATCSYRFIDTSVVVGSVIFFALSRSIIFHNLFRCSQIIIYELRNSSNFNLYMVVLSYFQMLNTEYQSGFLRDRYVIFLLIIVTQINAHI